MCADFQFYLNRQGPRGPQGYKGDKGDDGKTPVPRTGTNTPIETTVIFDTGDGNPYETPNLKYPIEDRGGNVVMLDRTNSTQYYGTPNQATDNSYGIVKLATPESVLDDPLDNDVVTYELFDNNNQSIKAVTDGLAGSITQLNTDIGAEVTNRTNADTQLTNKINTDVSNEATARSNADIALSGRIDNLTTSKANKSDVYTKTQTDSLLNNKSNVGHTHNYNDLTNKPDIGNGTITITQGGVVKGSFTTNQLSSQTISLESGGGGGGTTYAEGNGIDLTNDTISVKYDNNTLKLNESGQLYANIPTPETVDQVYDSTSTNAQSGVAIAGAGFLTSVPTATTSNLGLVQPDGTSITINDGVISTAGSTPSNMVTTDTDQTITGIKNITYLDIKGSSYTGGSFRLNSTGSIKYLSNGISESSSYLSISSSSLNVIRDVTGAVGLWSYGSNNTGILFRNGSYYGKIQYYNGNYVISSSNTSDTKIYKVIGDITSPTIDTSTNFLLEKDMLDGTTIQYNDTSGKIEVIGGGGSTPSNMVTTDTQQIITGRKDMAIINIQPSGSTGYLNYITPISSGSIAISKSTSYDTSGTSSGIILGFNNSAYMTTVAYGGSANYINMCTQYSTNTAEIRFCNGYKAGQVGSSHAGIGKYGDYTYIRNNNANDKKVYKITTGGSSSSSFTNFFLESDMLDGTYLKWDSTTGKITVDIQAIKDAIDALA